MSYKLARLLVYDEPKLSYHSPVRIYHEALSVGTRKICPLCIISRLSRAFPFQRCFGYVPVNISSGAVQNGTGDQPFLKPVNYGSIYDALSASKIYYCHAKSYIAPFAF
jgi:hypothetical protein